ncbi:MAG: Protein pelota [Candidatus Woesearchaeota archaeon]|nr:Protein pelota [Candidatus Woesearchaeota archaeon]
MQILKKQLKYGKIKLKITSLDDLWYLSQIIEPDDVVEGKTERKIKLKGRDDQTKSIIKKTIWLKLKVEKTQLHEYSDILKVQGIVIEGSENVPNGSHHSFNLKVGKQITIIKEKWLKYHLKQLKDSSSDNLSNILICVLDRENAFFAILRKKGYKILSKIKGDVSKKIDKSINTGDFYKEIITVLEKYYKRFDLRSIIIASPAFWKDELFKRIKNKNMRKKIVLATCNTAKKPAIQEILNRDEIKKVLDDQRMSQEVQLVEELLEEVSKNNKAVYGLKQTGYAIKAGAVEKFMISTGFIHKKRQKKSFSEVNSLMQKVEQMGGEISIINSENTAGKKLDSLGGIAAILRYGLVQ